MHRTSAAVLAALTLIAGAMDRARQETRIVNAIDLGTLKLRFFADFTTDNPSGAANLCD